LFFIWVAAASPLAALDHELLTVHMVQHLLLMTLAPPLLWLGAPRKALLHGLPQRFAQAVISGLLRSAPAQRLATALTHPAVCWVAAAATLVGWHIPPAFRLGLQSEVWHGIEQASFLATGLFFWWPVVQRLPNVRNQDWLIVVYLFLATLPCDILSGFLVFCDRVVYPVYLSSPHPLGLSALEDQQRAGALMWTCVTVVYLIAGAIFTGRLLSPQGAREYWIPQSDSQGNAVPHTVGPSIEAL
jgi:cytochrome c oxidase assembly factor CtaG